MACHRFGGVGRHVLSTYASLLKPPEDAPETQPVPHRILPVR
jgi:hypothetical protein